MTTQQVLNSSQKQRTRKRSSSKFPSEPRKSIKDKQVLIFLTVDSQSRAHFLSPDTLIVWQEPDGKDYALSFQDLEGCSEVWDFIQEVRKHLKSLGSSVLSLPTSTHTNLNYAQMIQARPHHTQSTPQQVAYTLVSFLRLRWPTFATSNAHSRPSFDRPRYGNE